MSRDSPPLLRIFLCSCRCRGSPWGAQRGRSPSVITPRCVRVYDIWGLSQRGGGQHPTHRIAAGRPLIPGRPGPCPGAPYSRPLGAGRSSHPARAGQPGSASAQRCRPAAARSYGPPPGTAAPARCSPPLPLTLSAPPGCARIASTGSRGPQQRPTLPDLPQLLRTAPRPPPCGGPLCPTPAATAPGCRAARLGRSAPGCSPKGTGRALGAGCGPPQYPPGAKWCSPPSRAVRPRICPPQRAAGLARARCCPRTGPPPG